MSENGQADNRDRSGQKAMYFIELRDVLADLYSDSYSIRRIVVDASIGQTRINFDNTPINTWHAVITEAEKTGRLDTLFSVVEREYETSERLRLVCEALRRSASQTDFDQTIDLHPQVVVSPTKLIRQCLEEGFDSTTIRSFCQDYLSEVAKRIEPHDRLDSIITSINSFCGQQSKFEYLWQAIKVERPQLFSKYYQRWQQLYQP